MAENSGSLQEGVSFKESIEKGYMPRESGEGQRPKKTPNLKSGKKSAASKC